MMSPDETLEASKGPFGIGGVNVASIGNLKKIWWAVKEADSPSPNDDDVSAAETALFCSHFLSTWGQVNTQLYLECSNCCLQGLPTCICTTELWFLCRECGSSQ